MEPLSCVARISYVARADLIIEQVWATSSEEGRLPPFVALLPGKHRPRLGRVAHAGFDAVQIIALTLARFALVGPLLPALGLAPVLGASLQIGVARLGVGIFRSPARACLLIGGRGLCRRCNRW